MNNPFFANILIALLMVVIFVIYKKKLRKTKNILTSRKTYYSIEKIIEFKKN